MPGTLETLVLDYLRPRGSDRWWLPAFLRARLEQQLVVFFADARASNEELVRLLKLIAVFEADAAYRDVAQDLIDVLRQIPQAVLRIETWRGRAVVDERHRELLSRFVSTNQEKRAPKIDASLAIGVKLRDLSRPIDPVEMRARSSAKRNAIRRMNDGRNRQRHGNPESGDEDRGREADAASATRSIGGAAK